MTHGGFLSRSGIATREAKEILNVEFNHCHHINLSGISGDFQKWLKSLKMPVYDISDSQIETSKYL